jgi:DNA mismatch repair protein MutS
MLEIYEDYVKTYRARYGDRVVVICQVGSFYELYDDGTGFVDLKTISELLQIQMTRRNKAVLEVSRANHLMSGFPDYALNKFANLLVDANYTVVVVSQVTPPPRPQRAVTQIVSPGTRLELNTNRTENVTNYLMVIYVDDVDYAALVAGVSVIDVTTGKSKTTELVPRKNDADFILDEILRLIYAFSPKEIALYGSVSPTNKSKLDEICSSTYVHDYTCDRDRDLESISFQNLFFGRVFKGKYGLLTPIEYLDLESLPLARLSLLLLMRFAVQHNEGILEKIDKPDILKGGLEKEGLQIPHTSIKQLNLAELINMINNCSTAIGRRYFKERLLNPYTDPAKIVQSYDAIASYDYETAKTVQKKLGCVYDLARLFRKVHLGLLHPADWIQIDASMNALVDCPGSPASQISDLMEFYRSRLDLNEVAKYHLDNITASFFRLGISEHVDELSAKIEKGLGFFGDIVTSLNPPGLDYFKLDSNERDGYYITITAKRWKELQKPEYTAKPVSSTSAVLKLSRPDFAEVNDAIRESKEAISSAVLQAYKEFLKTVSERFEGAFGEIISYVALTDFNSSCAVMAFDYRYVRPELLKSESGRHSFLEVSDLRHPIVERIQQQVEYVTNDITLDGNGILLYGINSAGKSTLMKAIGVSVIMAQAGMFVPCSKMRIVPYSQIFTRIPSGDDLMRGQSTFTVEICEIRNILKRADAHSLVIGDELCCGSESISAMSIVSAGIIELTRRGCSFIFASHLHDLIHIDRLKGLIEDGRLRVFHIGVFYDEVSKRLIYDRKLKPGQGATLYGLEVCKSLDMGVEFIALANEIRQNLMNIDASIIDPTRKSRYNSRKYIASTCAICGCEKTEEVHHIHEQAKADQQGYIGHFHKNALHNLVETCGKCHDAIHNGLVIVDGFRQTSDGIVLVSCDLRKHVSGSSKPEEFERVQLEIKGMTGVSVTKKALSTAVNYMKKMGKSGGV